MRSIVRYTELQEYMTFLIPLVTTQCEAWSRMLSNPLEGQRVPANLNFEPLYKKEFFSIFDFHSASTRSSEELVRLSLHLRCTLIFTFTKGSRPARLPVQMCLHLRPLHPLREAEEQVETGSSGARDHGARTRAEEDERAKHQTHCPPSTPHPA